MTYSIVKHYSIKSNSTSIYLCDDSSGIADDLAWSLFMDNLITMGYGRDVIENIKDSTGDYTRNVHSITLNKEYELFKDESFKFFQITDPENGQVQFRSSVEKNDDASDYMSMSDYAFLTTVHH